MNILLIDDDACIIEALEKSIDWISLGVENVYTAQSAGQGRQIIQDIPIQIVVSDIEMPRENGFGLIKWIREKGYIMKEILLTSFAEFEYANQAIRYGCFAYALKPIDFEELEDLIAKAIKAEAEALAAVNFKKYYEYWSTSEKIRKEQFWREIFLNQSLSPEMLLKQNDLYYQDHHLFVPVIVDYFTWENETRDYQKGMFEWNLKNLLYTSLSTVHLKVEGVISAGDGQVAAVIGLSEAANRQLLLDELADAVERYQERIKKRLKLECCITVGKVWNLAELRKNVPTLLESAGRYIVNQAGIVNYAEQTGSFMVSSMIAADNVAYCPPDFLLWEEFVTGGARAGVEKAAFDYLDMLYEKQNLTREIMERFILDFLQMLTSALARKDKKLYDMEGSFFTVEQMNRSLKSLDYAKQCLCGMLNMVFAMLTQAEDNISMAGRVKEYIDQNLDKDITRESLAEMVFLNPDYLARIFKKEIGESIGTYLNSKRMETAREYLEKTNEPINTIAMKVGYDNFSYFSKVFKNNIGVTPKEYRRQR